VVLLLFGRLGLLGGLLVHVGKRSTGRKGLKGLGRPPAGVPNKESFDAGNAAVDAWSHGHVNGEQERIRETGAAVRET